LAAVMKERMPPIRYYAALDGYRGNDYSVPD
jgi:hypothetical protein